ncbi:CoA transferase [Nocardia sp. NPDC050193]
MAHVPHLAEPILTGLKVADFTMGWAGPLLTQLLADHGAEVVKIESCSRVDWWRTSRALFAEGSEELDHYWEQGPLFNAVNSNKMGITLDLDQPRGRELALDLIARADLVVENFTPRVMKNLGFDYATLSSGHSDLIMVSMPGFGTGGPWADYKATAFITESLAGVSARCGYSGSGPSLISTSFADPNAGVIGALSVLMALRHRRRTGVGQHIEVAQTEALTPHLGTELMDLVMNGARPRRLGNHREGGGPRGVYPVRGADRWIAIDIETDSQWDHLARLIGLDEAERKAWCTGEGRFADRARVDARVGEWTRAADGPDLERHLQGAGVPAGRVQDAADLRADPHLAATGFFHTLDRKYVGAQSYPGPPVRLSRTPATRRMPAPLLGEHNTYVLGTLLGLPVGEISALESAGVIGTEPRTS